MLFDGNKRRELIIELMKRSLFGVRLFEQLTPKIFGNGTLTFH
jgi:hypothetical protein